LGNRGRRRIARKKLTEGKKRDKWGERDLFSGPSPTPSCPFAGGNRKVNLLTKLVGKRGGSVTLKIKTGKLGEIPKWGKIKKVCQILRKTPY